MEEEAWNGSFALMKEESREKGVKYFSREENNEGNRYPWFTGFRNMERGTISTLNRLRANHYNLRESLYRKKMIDSPECECGEGIEDINHVIWECGRYEVERVALKGNLLGRGMREGEDVIERIDGKIPTVGRLIVGFLKKIGRDI